MSHLRAAIVMLAVLMLATLACTTVTRMFQPEQGVAPGEAPAATTTASPVEAAASEVRRLAAQPTPTPFYVESEDDVRNELPMNTETARSRASWQACLTSSGPAARVTSQSMNSKMTCR